MRIAIYNQMFGLNGKSFWANLIGHWTVHYQTNPEKIWKKVNLEKTVEIIKKSKADIAGIIEVLEGQEEKLKEGLRKEGYNFFLLGKGHKTKYSGLYVQELVASKRRGEQKNIGEWPVENKLGGGGGLVCVYYPEPQFHLILAHFGLPSKKYYWEQIGFLQDYLRKINGKVIVLGDFNSPYKNLKPYLSSFELVSGEIKSCSTTPIIKWFYNKDVDHILTKGFKLIKCETIEGRSDHKLIYADLK